MPIQNWTGIFSYGDSVCYYFNSKLEVPNSFNLLS